MNKKGLSTVVTTLIIILLALVAIGIVWAVVSNIFSSGTEQASSGFGGMFLNLKIQKFQLESNGNLQVSVKRNAGAGNLSAINFVISDGENSVVIKKETTLQELGTKVFTIDASEMEDVGIVKEISISPVLKSGEAGNIADKREFTTKQVLENLGAVAWWKLNGNANDEFGSNSGNVIGSVQFVAGKSGQAASFDGTITKWIKIDSFTNFPMGNSPRTMLAWIKPSGYPDASYNGIVAYSAGCNGGSLLSIKNNGMLSQAFWCNDMAQTTGASAQLNSWNLAIFTYDGTTGILYLNGNLVATKSFTNVATTSTGGSPRIGCTDSPGRCFQGQIEDVVIFNRALTQNQVTALYELNLA